MSEDERQFLSRLGQPQARFTVEQTAWALNFQPYEILALVPLKILTPMGNPAANAIKYFCVQEILELAKDKTFLKRATNAMYQARYKKNHRPTNGRVNVVEDDLFSSNSSGKSRRGKSKLPAIHANNGSFLQNHEKADS